MESHGPVQPMTLSSVTQFRCCDCERDFQDEGALANHLRSSKVHKPKEKKKKKVPKPKEKKKKKEQQAESKQRVKCPKCAKTFTNEGAMEQHLMSVRHKPLSDIKCVADDECRKKFNCPSAQLHHLESGKCVSGMTKSKLNAAIAANDTGRIITSGRATTEWLLDDNQSMTSTLPIQSPILTPTSTEFTGSCPPSGILTPTSTLSASTNLHSLLTFRPRTGNGSQRCPLCPPSRTRTFKPSALQQHLTSSVHAQTLTSMLSPVHDEISFHCPSALMGMGRMQRTVKQFSTVSGLAQHLESGACNGGKETFRRMVDYVQKEMKSMGFGGLKLLS